MYITHRHPICCTNTTNYHLLQCIPGIEMLPVFPFTVVADINQSYPVQLLWSWLAVTESFQTGSQLHRYKFLHHWPTNLEGKKKDLIAASEMILKSLQYMDTLSFYLSVSIIQFWSDHSFPSVTKYRSNDYMSSWVKKKASYTYIYDNFHHFIYCIYLSIY